MRRLVAATGLCLALAAGGATAAPRVVSLDPCADQYVLALSPRPAVAGLSFRARDGDSFLAAQARGLPMRRASLESVLAAQPQLVLRTWGGDAGLTRRLQGHGIRVLTLEEARDFDGVRANVRRAAAAVGDPARGEALIAAMDAKLRAAAARPSFKRVAYLTPGGATAGPGVFVDALLGAAGLRNAETRPGYRVLSLERLALEPPQALVLGFFDAFSLDRNWWSPARSAVIRTAVRERVMASLPGAVLSCPAWFAADGVLTLSNAART
jgi:iron complex transport system substrate-binding protein